MARTARRAVVGAAALLLAVAVPSYAMTTAPQAVQKRCDPRNPGHRAGDTDVAGTIGQEPSRVGIGLAWWMWASTDPSAPGVHVENWGHQWFQDVRVDDAGAHASGNLVGGMTGTHYLDYQVNVYKSGATPTACEAVNTG